MRSFLLLGALALGACTFQLDGLGLSDLAAPDGGGGSTDLATPADLAAPPDLLPSPDLAPDPCGAAPAPIAGAAVANCVLGFSPTVDGVLNDWPSTRVAAQSVRFADATVVHDGTWTGNKDNDLSGSWGAAWDQQALYLAVTVNDDARRIVSPGLWQGDAIEIYLHGGGTAGAYGTTDFQLVFAPDGSGELYKGGGAGTMMQIPAGIVAKVSNTGTQQGWNLEISIPWTLLGGMPTNGRVVGVDVQLDDEDIGTLPRDRDLLWLNANTATCTECAGACFPYCSSTSFGQLQLGGR